MPGQFSADVSKWVTRSRNAIANLHQATCLTLFKNVILGTPVGNPDFWQSSPPEGYVGGRLRGNWQFTDKAPAEGELANIDASGTETISNMQTGLGLVDFKSDFSVYLTNNLPYAEPIEMGYSTQAPEGMIRKNVILIQSNLQNG